MEGEFEGGVGLRGEDRGVTRREKVLRVSISCRRLFKALLVLAIIQNLTTHPKEHDHNPRICS